MKRARDSRPPVLLRGIALAAAGLVALLSLFAASPQLHAWLHAGANGHPSPEAKACPSHSCPHSHPAPAPAGEDCDELCLVAQFSHGHASTAGEPPALHFRPLPTRAAPAPDLIGSPRAPAAFLPPVCGPPAV